jgi:hypothetical protein
MSSFNPNLTYFVERLQGFSTNVFRLESQQGSSATATSSSIITFDIPSNAIVSLRSFKIFANAGADVVAGAGGRLPPINDLVERVEVSVGGITLSQGANFINVLQEMKKSLGATYAGCDATMGHPEYVREKSYVNKLGAGGAVISGVLNEFYPPNDNPVFCISDLEGFFSTAEPKLLDTSLLPDLRVRLHLASDNVLGSVNGIDLDGTGANDITDDGTGGARYNLTNIHATIECIGLADQAYDQMLASMMSSQGFLEIPYKNYTNFQTVHSGSSRFTVSTQSLDRVWVGWRSNGYDTQGGLVAIEGYKKTGAFVSNSDAGFAGGFDIGKPDYDVGGVLDTNCEKYKSKYFNFTEASNTFRAQLQLNGAYYPQFTATLGDLYGISKNSLMGNRESKTMTLDQYKNNYCVQCFRLNMPDSEYSRLISGLDTRAVNLQGIIKTENATADNTVDIFCETTEVIRVGAGRAVEIIS